MLDIDERDIENVNFNNRSRSSSARKRRDSYDYMNTVQMLGEYFNWDNVMDLNPPCNTYTYTISVYCRE